MTILGLWTYIKRKIFYVFEMSLRHRVLCQSLIVIVVVHYIYRYIVSD